MQNIIFVLGTALALCTAFCNSAFAQTPAFLDQMLLKKGEMK
jgi:hypothetical protein